MACCHRVVLAAIPLVSVLVRRVNTSGATTFGLIKAYSFNGFLGLLGGFMVGYTSAGFINGYFDRSPPRLEPVRIVPLWHQTTNFVLRTYELEYHPYPNGEQSRKMVAVETLSQFQPDSLGVADIGSGWLGMKWLRDFHPVVWKTMDVGGDEALPGEITFQMPGNGPPTRIAPLVQLNERLVLSPPESLLPELRVRMISHLTNVMKASIKE